jgi:hypothetical protein
MRNSPPETGRMLTFSLYPDYTVGPGVTPDLLTLFAPLVWGRKALAGYTAGGELRPALRIPGTAPAVPF